MLDRRVISHLSRKVCLKIVSDSTEGKEGNRKMVSTCQISNNIHRAKEASEERETDYPRAAVEEPTEE